LVRRNKVPRAYSEAIASAFEDLAKAADIFSLLVLTELLIDNELILWDFKTHEALVTQHESAEKSASRNVRSTRPDLPAAAE
jgi:hypothetical protein